MRATDRPQGEVGSVGAAAKPGDAASGRRLVASENRAPYARDAPLSGALDETAGKGWHSGSSARSAFVLQRGSVAPESLVLCVPGLNPAK